MLAMKHTSQIRLNELSTKLMTGQATEHEIEECHKLMSQWNEYYELTGLSAELSTKRYDTTID